MTADTGKADTGKIVYEERQEPAFLEYVLVDRRRGLPQTIMIVCAAMGIALGIFHLYVAMFGTPEGRSFRSIHLSVMLILAFFMKPLFRKSMRDPLTLPGDPKNLWHQAGFAIDLTLICLVLFVQIWTIYDIDAFTCAMARRSSPTLSSVAC